MNIFHKHNWVIIRETYYSPRDVSGIKVISDYLLERIIEGVTTILWECSTCKKIRKEEMLGKSI